MPVFAKQLLLGLSGPTVATNHGIARFDGTTGKIVEDSQATVDDSGNISATASDIIRTQVFA